MYHFYKKKLIVKIFYHSKKNPYIYKKKPETPALLRQQKTPIQQYV